MLRRIFVVRFKLADILEKENMSKNHLSVISNVRFDTIGKYVKGDIERVSLDISALFVKP